MIKCEVLFEFEFQYKTHSVYVNNVKIIDKTASELVLY